jgi:hexulose-6-phosphate isomerase
MQGRLSPMIDNRIQSFPWKGWQKEFEIASKNNINTIEWTIDDDRLYENPLLTEKGIQEINSLTKKYQINIPSLTGDCFMQNPFWKSIGAQKEKLQNDFINILHGCSKANISIVLVPLVDNGSIENDLQENNLLTFLSSQTELLKKLSVRVCFESDFPPKKLKDFIDRYDYDLFGINYDTGNSASMGFDPSEEFSQYGDRIINIHIKDRPLGGTTVPLGEGDTNFSLIFRMLKEHDYHGNLILQTARAKDNDHLSVLKNYHNITIEHAKKIGLPVNIS